jgi:hypothetical protein
VLLWSRTHRHFDWMELSCGLCMCCYGITVFYADCVALGLSFMPCSCTLAVKPPVHVVLLWSHSDC